MKPFGRLAGMLAPGSGRVTRSGKPGTVRTLGGDKVVFDSDDQTVLGYVSAGELEPLDDDARVILSAALLASGAFS